MRFLAIQRYSVRGMLLSTEGEGGTHVGEFRISYAILLSLCHELHLEAMEVHQIFRFLSTSAAEKGVWCPEKDFKHCLWKWHLSLTLRVDSLDWLWKRTWWIWQPHPSHEQKEKLLWAVPTTSVSSEPWVSSQPLGQGSQFSTSGSGVTILNLWLRTLSQGFFLIIVFRGEKNLSTERGWAVFGCKEDTCSDSSWNCWSLIEGTWTLAEEQTLFW